MIHKKRKHEKRAKNNISQSFNLASKTEPKLLNFMQALLIAFFGTTFFAVQMAKTSFVLTSPSDPLQYVQPALDPSHGFDFLDRIFLWLYLRTFAAIPIAREFIGPTATLVITSLIALIIGLWIAFRFSLTASGIFLGLCLLNPFLISISTYTYPMQLMTLVLISSLIMTSELQNPIMRNVMGGIGIALAILSKVQGAGLAITLVGKEMFGIKSKRVFFNILLIIFGFVITVQALLILLIIVDGKEATFKLFAGYFSNGTATTQFDGRNGAGGFPPFYQLFFEPIFLFSILGVLGCIFLFGNVERFLAIAATVQILLLIFIYVVSQRGGPLIHNYLFDFLVLGSACFAIAIGRFLNFKGTQLDFIFGLLVVFVSGILTVAKSGISSTPSQLGIGFGYSRSLDLAIFGAITFLVVGFSHLLDSVLPMKSNGRDNAKRFWDKKNVLSMFCTVLVLITLSNNVSRGYSDSRFKILESSQYHKLAGALSKLEGDVCVEVSMGRPNSDDAGPRLRGIFETFYSLDSKAELWINGLNDKGIGFRGSCNFFVTDIDSSIFASRIKASLDRRSVLIADRDGKVIDAIKLPNL